MNVNLSGRVDKDMAATLAKWFNLFDEETKA
jgi:hypothetical protein